MPTWTGWSCHTPRGYDYLLVAALTQDATQFEFHVMTDKASKTPDQESSLILEELPYVMKLIQRTVPMLGTGYVEQVDREAVLSWRGRWQDAEAS